MVETIRKIGIECRAALVMTISFLLAGTTFAQEEVPAPPPVREVQGGIGLIGNMSCSSVTCHGRQDPLRRMGADNGQEFVHWMHDDPHAKAARTLQSDWFHQILVKASNRPDGQPDPKVYRQCAACHDPMGIALETKDKPLALPREAESLTSRGIGCETCHGGAEKWVSRHFRGESARELTDLGMINLNDLPTRARQCSVCHVGDAEHDLPHDFYGAGHPPLQFEVASFHALIKRKHWDEATERRRQPEFESRLWLAGQLAGMEGSLELLHKRAGVLKEVSWPEFAEHDCQGCHQQFRAVGSEAVVLKGGFPQWRKWSYSSADLIGRAFPGADIDTQIGEISKSMNGYPPNPEPVAAQARSAAHQLAKLTLPLNPAEALTSTLISSVAMTKLPPEAQWGEQTQRYLALIAIESAGRDQFQKSPAGDAAEFQRLTLEYKTRAYRILHQLNRNPELKKSAVKSTLSSQPRTPETQGSDSTSVNLELQELAELLQRRDKQFPFSRN